MEYAMLGLRLAVVAFMGWAVTKAFLSLARYTGVIPYKPFASRKEYLEAALEMNLEEFIERAKATPRYVIHKPEKAPPFIKTMGDAIDHLSKLDRKSVLDLSRVARVDSNPFAAGQVQAGSSGVNGAGVNGGVGLIGISPAINAERFKVGQWFRVDNLISSSALVKVIDFCNGIVTCTCEDGIKSYRPVDLGPAQPRPGEWWRWTKKDLLDGFHAYNLEPFLFVLNQAPPRSTLEVEAGNLEPVNFGKGPGCPAVSPTGKGERFKSGQWLRVKGWHRMIGMRCNPAADAEIRAVYVQVLEEILKKSRYAADFKKWKLQPSPDGIGDFAVEEQ